ncbi:MAG TPA: hypothetical protein IAA78_08035 [Candidatus Avamphibacillus intestinigallinarum]|nr:hypothetical protein [Candidatus Avamphibacillus intestinigallinarum]
MNNSKQLLEEIKEESDLKNISGGGDNPMKGPTLVYSAIMDALTGGCSWGSFYSGKTSGNSCPNGGVGSTCR